MTEQNFKVGDRVEVIGNIDPDYFATDHIGDTGTVVEIVQPDSEYGNGWNVISDGDGKVRIFFECELKKRED